MNARERVLAAILILVMVGAAGGVAFWQMIWSPYKRHEQDIGKLQKEVNDLETEKDRVQKVVQKYNSDTKKKSLPADIALAKREYNRLLINMLRKADFDPTDLKVNAKDPNTTQVPTVTAKKPAYTKLEFDVAVKGDLMSVVDFMYHFYRQPLLHQIKKITVVKPSGNRGRGGDLDVIMVVQAIVLDKADDRGTLFATLSPVAMLGGGIGAAGYNRRSIDGGLGSPFISTDVLARAGSAAAYQNSTPLDEYRRIAGKNIFYPPSPVVPKKESVEPKVEQEPKRVKGIDLSPFVALIQVSHNDDGSAQAVVYDRYNKHYYEIEQNTSGATRVFKFMYETSREQGIVFEVKKKFDDDEYDYRFLTFGSEETSNERSFRVKRILESDIIIEPYDAERRKMIRGPATAVMGGTAELSLPGTLISWHIGQVLKSGEEGHSPLELSASGGRYALLRPLSFDGPLPPPPKDDPRRKDPRKR